MFINAFRVVGVVGIFGAIKKAHHLRTYKCLTITIYLEIPEMIEKPRERERVIGHNKLVLSSAAQEYIVRMDVSQKVMTAILVYLAGALADQQYEVPDILFSEIALLLTTELNLLLESFLKDAFISADEYPIVATGSLLLNSIILAGEYCRRAIHVGQQLPLFCPLIKLFRLGK